MRLLRQYLEGATPSKFGARPLNNARGPSVFTICLIQFHSTTPPSFGGLTCIVDGQFGLKVEIDDCCLVLTTSRGQVTIAPTVPPTLEFGRLQTH